MKTQLFQRSRLETCGDELWLFSKGRDHLGVQRLYFRPESAR